jgi:hypothetical protein
VALPEPRLGLVVVVELEVALARAGDLDDQRERLFEQWFQLVLTTEIEQPTIEVTL